MAAETERRGQRYTIEELQQLRGEPPDSSSDIVDAEPERRGQRYTTEELIYLKESPLVQKPDGLPSIEQWMEPAVDPNANRRRSGVMRDADATLVEGRTERPLLINAGMGHFGRRASTQAEETVLGPPKLAFTSASRGARAAAENAEKRIASSLEGDTPFAERFLGRGERWTRDRDADRTRDKPTYANGRRIAREEGEGWTNVKARKSLGQDDFDRGFRNGDRDKDRQQRDGDENTDSVQRRSHLGREKLESRWGNRRDDSTKEGEGISRFGGTAQGWRDRERDRDRDRDRDWTRGGGTKAEADPEWMDTSVAKEKKSAKTQEDFQKWKEEFGRVKKETPAVEKTDPLTEVEQPTPAPPVTSTISSKPATPMANLEGQFDLFGMWGKENAVAEAPAPPKAKPKGKASRFTSLFAAAEEPAKAPQAAAPTPPGHSVNGSKDEDKEGFQRILQMLGSSNISGAPSGPPGIPASAIDARQGGVSLDLGGPPPEQLPETLVPRQPGSRAFEERNLLESFLPRPAGLESRPSHTMFSPVSPDPEPSSDQFRAPRPDSNRPAGDYPIQRPPSRTSSAQGMLNLHSIITNRANREPNRENKQTEREFLLALMRDSSTPTQMAGQNMSRPPPEHHNMPPFYDVNAQKATMQQQKGRPVQPGYIDEQRMLAQNELMRREAEQREANLREASFRDIREMREREAAMQQPPEHMRKPNPRFAPGFDDPAIIGLQRRATGDLPRQMTNMGIPSQPVPDLPYMRDPRMAQTPNERAIAPPPGFGPPGMRQPPGFGGPQQPMGPLSAGNTPYGHPAMGGPQGMGGMFPNQGRGQMGPPGPPQGYFPPPGFVGPPMGMGGRGDDPRMMMGGRPEFEGFGGGPGQQGLNRPGAGGGPGGRPPNMYNMQ